MDAAVRVENLRVVRGGRAALAGISFEVERGSVTGLLGPSGSGKSTLMRALVGVQEVESGRVEVLGEPAGSASLRSRVAYMTQELSVYRDLTVRENLEYFASLIDAGRQRVAEVIDLVDLGDFATRPVERLSGGQQTRVSIATALLGSPQLLVLDEPTVGLDPLLRRSLWGLFRRLAGERRTLVISSHVMDEAEHCDRLLLLREGQLLADETPADLLQATHTLDLESAFVELISEQVPA